MQHRARLVDGHRAASVWLGHLFLFPFLEFVMSVTATIVAQSGNRLRYLITASSAGGTVTITSTGAATPDLQTDSVGGPIKQASLVRTTGIGSIAPGTMLTQAQARALFLSDNTTSISSATSATGATIQGLIPQLKCQLVPRDGVTPDFDVDANVDGSGNPTITVSRVTAAVGDCYLDVIAPGAIG